MHILVAVLVVGLSGFGAEDVHAEEEATSVGTASVEWHVGSKPDEWLEAAGGIFIATLKRTSAVRTEAMTRSLNLTGDLGTPSHVIAPFLGLRGNLGTFGWVRGELLHFESRDSVGVIDQPSRFGDLDRRPGDIVMSDVREIWARALYGFEFRLRLPVTDQLTLDVYASPTIGVGLWDFEVRVRGLVPATARARTSLRPIVFAPGATLGVEVAEMFRLELEVEWLPSLGAATPRLTSTRVEEWERVRAFLGFRLFFVELTLGWRYMNVSAERERSISADTKLRGYDVSIGIRF